MNYQQTIANRRKKKPLHKYEQILLAFYACVGAGLTHQETASTLNEAGITTITGKEWNEINVQVMLHRLNTNAPGHITAAKDVLLASGKLSAALVHIASKGHRRKLN